MGNSSSSGGSDTVNPPPASSGNSLPRKYFTGTSSCDPATEAMVGVQLAPYNSADAGGQWGFGLSAVCAKVDGTTKVVKFKATGGATYTTNSRTISDTTQQCPADSYASGVGLSGGGALGVQLKCVSVPTISADPSNWQYLALRAGALPTDPTTQASADQMQSDYDAKWGALLKSRPAPAAKP